MARVDDLLLTAGLVAFGVVGTLGAAAEQPTARPLDPAAWALLLVTAGALPARRHHPAVVLGVTAAATVAWLAASYPYGPVFLPLSVAVYTVAAATPPERLPALAGCVLGLLAVLVAVGVGDSRVWRWGSYPGCCWPGWGCCWCRYGSVWWRGPGAAAPPRRRAAAPTTSGCGLPGSCTTWCRTASR
jgi:hypothetical protein